MWDLCPTYLQLQIITYNPPINFILYSPITFASTSIIITINHQMGICGPQRKDKQIVYTSKSVHQPDKFKKVDFYFQSQNLLRIEADCLVIFCDEKMNLSKNQFLAHAGKLQTKKVTQFAESYATNNKIKITVGTVMLFPINISTLRFKRICLLCLKVWDGHEKMKSNLAEIFENAFKQIVESQIQSLAITEFNEQLGIPVQIGCKVLLSTLEAYQQNLKAVTFLFQNSSSQGYYMERISKDKVELSSVYKQSRQSSISNYY